MAAPKGSITIKTAAVIGAGVMGAGIAAHLANAGIPVLLLDIVPKGLPKGADRSLIARSAVDKLLKTRPEPLMHPRVAKLITPGNIEDHLDRLKDIDWVVEAVIERLDIKHSLYEKIAKVRGKHTVVSSNTSTLPLAELMRGVPKAMQPFFFITHFFNPPRYMRLLEIVATARTDQAALDAVLHTADHRLGKSIVHCNDTPGFIANRIGTYWLHAASTLAVKMGVGVEEADAALGKPAGVPSTGVFGLMDLVGLDLMPHVLGSLEKALPRNDAFHKLGNPPKLFETMIAQGLTGRKGKGGFYRLNEAKEKLVIHLQHGTYSPARKPKIAAVQAARKAGKKHGLRALIEHDSTVGRYADNVLTHTLAYAAHLLGEIAGDIDSIDRAMRLGYNWGDGPFEMIDRLGTAWFAAHLSRQKYAVPAIIELAAGRPLYRFVKGERQMLTLKGIYVPVPKPEGVISLAQIKRAQKQPLIKTLSASVWNAGDGVAVLEFHSKMNSLDPFSLRAINKALDILPSKKFKALVIYNEAPHFSVGANILMLKLTGMLRLWGLIDWILCYGQNTYQRMKYHEKLTIVGAPAGMALGGGAEVLLHCHAVVPGAETYVGLVEAGVGIVPGWGGCKELLGRALTSSGIKGGPMPAIAQAFETIATAKVATSAMQAQSLGFFRETDTVVMNPDRILAEAKSKALHLAANRKPVQPFEYALPGPTGAAALHLALHDFALKGLATPHDLTVGKALARVLSGGDTDITAEPLTEQQMLNLEREQLVALAKTRQTRARIGHMLTTGKPLRN